MARVWAFIAKVIKALRVVSRTMRGPASCLKKKKSILYTCNMFRRKSTDATTYSTSCEMHTKVRWTEGSLKGQVDEQICDQVNVGTCPWLKLGTGIQMFTVKFILCTCGVFHNKIFKRCSLGPLSGDYMEGGQRKKLGDEGGASCQALAEGGKAPDQAGGRKGWRALQINEWQGLYWKGQVEDSWASGMSRMSCEQGCS